VNRTDYVLDQEGWDESTRIAAIYDVLDVVAPCVTSAETDMPWGIHHTWPPDVALVADRLRGRFVSEQARASDYLQTGVQTLRDDEARSDFMTFAPYALDATFWGDDAVLAELADEGSSLVVALTHEQRDGLELALGSGRVVSLQAWRERHPSAPSALRRLVRRLGRR
jgi:hypothetical protein